MGTVTGLRRLVAGFTSFAIAIIVQLVVNSVFLEDAWEIMANQGILRTDAEGASGVVMYLVVVTLSIWVMTEFCQRTHSKVDNFYFGLLTGVLTSIPFIVIHNFYVVQWQIPVVMIVANLVGYSLAGLAYGLFAKE